MVGANSVTAEFWKYESRLLRKPLITKTGETSWENLINHSEEELHDDTTFPDKFRFEQNGKIVLLAETEWWSSIGGPKPYHDSVTISFFSATDLNAEFANIFREAAKRLKLETKN